MHRRTAQREALASTELTVRGNRNRGLIPLQQLYRCGNHSIARHDYPGRYDRHTSDSPPERTLPPIENPPSDPLLSPKTAQVTLSLVSKPAK
jgi:hypothetical protein